MDHALNVKQKMAKSGLLLILRQVMVQGLNITGSILLARILSPADFGLFAIFTFFLTFLIAFGDVGLAGSLIREEAEPTDSDYAAVFSIQFLLVTVAAALFLLFAPILIEAYGLSAEAVNAFRLLGLILWITAFMVIPIVKLERSLAFRQIAVIDVAQALAFNFGVVILAWAGCGIWSIATALLCRTLVGVGLANKYVSWRPCWLWNWSQVSKRISFGVHYQGVKFISLIKDSVSPVIIGYLLGAASVGYVNWAGMLAAYPVMALFVLQRLYLPAFAQMQRDRAQLAQVIENVIWMTNSIAAPLAVMTLFFSEPITRIIFGEQWLEGLPLLYWFWGANLFVATATPIMSLLDSVGLARVNFKFSIIWMLGNWMLGVPLLIIFGLPGYAAANFFVQLTNVFLFRAAQKEASFKILKVILPLWSCAGLVGAAFWTATIFWPVADLWNLTACGITAIMTYVVAVYVCQSARVLAGLKLVRG